MFPRYNKKIYTIKTPKEKMAYEKKVLIRSAFCMSIVSLGIILSFFSFCPRTQIKYFLHSTYTPRQWLDLAHTGAKGVKTYSVKIVNSYTNLILKAEKNAGIKEKPKTAPLAKAKSQPKVKEEKSVPKDEPIQPTDPKEWNTPLKNGCISSPFGSREHPITKKPNHHTGVDIAADEGETVVGAYPGYIVNTGYDDANGYYAVAEHDDGITTVYAHLSKVSVSEGDYVSKRIKVGEVGSTGISTGPHLHFEIKKDGKSVNPENYVDF